MTTITAYWDETIYGDPILFLADEDSDGYYCPEELSGGWMEDGLNSLAEKAKELGLLIWVEEELRFL
jgi:hypothetical protein